MSQFCKQCAIETFGLGRRSNFIGQTSTEQWSNGVATVALCDGCGPTMVDPVGICVSQECDKHRTSMTLGQVLTMGEQSGYPLVFSLTLEGGEFVAKLTGCDRIVASVTDPKPSTASKRLLSEFTAACKRLAT